MNVLSPKSTIAAAVVRVRIVVRLLNRARRKPRRSAAAYAVDNVGNAASANPTPTMLTAADW